MNRGLLFILALGMTGCGNEQGFSSDLKADPAVTARPYAVVQGVPLAHPEEAIGVDGTASYDPDDENASLLYTWEVVSAPADAEYTLNFANTSTPEFIGTTLGEYEIALLVTDEDEFDSENPAGVVIEVVPWEDLQVDLQWDLPGVDLDLHLIGPEGEYFTESDCYYGNPAPDWGVEGDATDNPSLSVDDEGSTQSETVLLPRPSSGSYSIVVHYVNSKESTSYITTPTLRVMAGGSELITMAGQNLSEPGEVLQVGVLDWNTLDFNSVNLLTTHSDLGGPPINQ
jgi:hypothetical protein